MNSTPSSLVNRVFVHDVVFALALDEVHPRQLLVAGEAAHRCGKRVSDLPERSCRSDRQPKLALDIPEQPTGVLQLRHIGIAVHPADALQFEHHVIGQDVGDGAR